MVMKNVFIFTEEGKCGYEECVYFYRRKCGYEECV